MYIGNVLRYHLFVLLKTRRAFSEFPGVRDGGSPGAYDITEFEKPVSFLAPKVEEVHVDEMDVGFYIDLKPFINPHPYII